MAQDVKHHMVALQQVHMQTTNPSGHKVWQLQTNMIMQHHQLPTLQEPETLGRSDAVDVNHVQICDTNGSAV